MFPILFRFDQFAIHTYGVMLALGFLLAILVTRKEARRIGLDPEIVMDLAFYLLIGALAGSRLFYVVTQLGGIPGQPGCHRPVLARGARFLRGAGLRLPHRNVVRPQTPFELHPARRPRGPRDPSRTGIGQAGVLRGRVMLWSTRGGSVGGNFQGPGVSGPARNSPAPDPALRIRRRLPDFPGSARNAPQAALPGKALLVLPALLFPREVHHRVLPRRSPGLGDPPSSFDGPGGGAHRDPRCGLHAGLGDTEKKFGVV